MTILKTLLSSLKSEDKYRCKVTYDPDGSKMWIPQRRFPIIGWVRYDKNLKFYNETRAKQWLINKSKGIPEYLYTPLEVTEEATIGEAVTGNAAVGPRRPMVFNEQEGQDADGEF